MNYTGYSILTIVYTRGARIVVPKGKRRQIADYAAQQGKRMNRFINDAIDAQMKSGTEKE